MGGKKVPKKVPVKRREVRKKRQQYGTAKWHVRQKYRKYARRCYEYVRDFLRREGLLGEYYRQMLSKYGEEYFLLFAYCSGIDFEEEELSRLIGNARGACLQGIQGNRKPFRTLAGICEWEMKISRYGYAYVAGMEIIQAYERARDIDLLKQQQPGAVIIPAAYTRVLELAIAATERAGMIEADASVEEIVTGRRKIYPPQEVAGKEKGGIIEALKEITRMGEKEKILEMYGQEEKRERSGGAVGRTGKRGRAGGVKNIKNAIAYTAIARN